MDESIKQLLGDNPPGILDFLSGYELYLDLLNRCDVYVASLGAESYSIRINEYLNIDGAEAFIDDLFRQIRAELILAIKKAPSVPEKRNIANDWIAELTMAQNKIALHEGLRYHRNFKIKEKPADYIFNEKDKDIQVYYDLLAESYTIIREYVSEYGSKIDQTPAEELLKYYHEQEVREPSISNPLAFFDGFFSNPKLLIEMRENFLTNAYFVYAFSPRTESVEVDEESDTITVRLISDNSIKSIDTFEQGHLKPFILSYYHPTINCIKDKVRELNSREPISDFLRNTLHDIRQIKNKIESNPIFSKYKTNLSVVNGLYSFIKRNYGAEYLQGEIFMNDTQEVTLQPVPPNTFTWLKSYEKLEALYEEFTQVANPIISVDISRDTFKKAFSGRYSEALLISWVHKTRKSGDTATNLRTLIYFHWQLLELGIIRIGAEATGDSSSGNGEIKELNFKEYIINIYCNRDGSFINKKRALTRAFSQFKSRPPQYSIGNIHNVKTRLDGIIARLAR